MQAWIDETLGRLLRRWVGAVERRPRRVVVAALLLAGLSLATAATRLGINADTDAILSEELRFRSLQRSFEAAFPLLTDPLVLVVDAATPEGVRDATERLAASLRAEPEFFRNVFVPGGGPFFARQGLLFLSVEQLEELGDQLARAQPFLAELAQDPTVPGLFAMLEQALDPQQLELDVDLATVLERLRPAVEAAAAGTPAPVSFENLLLRDAESAQPGRRGIVLLQANVDYTSFVPARRAMDRVRAIVEELGLARDPVAEVRITGEIALSTEELTTVRDQAATAGVASFLMVSLVLAIGLGSARFVLATVVALLVGLSVTAGFAALAVGHLNMLSVAFTVLFIGLGVDFAIHYCLRTRESLAGGASGSQALQRAAGTVGGALTLCAFTTAIGFYSFVPTDFSGVAELGLISGSGMLIALVSTLTVLPALLALGGTPSSSRGLGVVPPFPRLPLRHPRAVQAVSALLALACLAALPRLRFDANPLAVRDPGAESVRAMRDLMQDAETSPWGADALAPDPESAAALAARLETLPSVGRTLTLADFVPRDQQRKIELIEELSFFLALPPELPNPPASKPDAVRAAAASLREHLSAYAAGAGDDPAAAPARDLVRALERLEDGLGAEHAAQLDANLLAPVRSLLGRLSAALAPTPVELAQLPEELRARYVSADGRVRVQVFPESDLDDSKALATFVDQVVGVAPDASGVAVRIVESARAITRALVQAFGVAFVCIGLILFALWRRVVDTVLALAPLVLAALLTAAVTVLIGLPLNFADVIVLPLLLGIGVDSGIHLVHRHRHEDPAGERDLLDTSTARAVFWSALTTLASFGTLAFSTHLGLASLGLLLTIGVAMTLACNLLVLPALLVSVRRDR